MKRLLVAVVILAAEVAAGQEASYVVQAGAVPVPRAVNGYVQNVTATGPDGHLVQVSTSVSPIGSTATYEAVAAAGPAPGVPAGFRLPAGLRSQLTADLGAWEAATLILEHVAAEVRYDPSDPGPQDALSVLARRTGRCSGLANAGAALLQSAGFEARTVSGLLVTYEAAVPHRWLECRLPDAGWVASDPTLGLWLVTPSHLAFDRPVARIPTIERTGGFDLDLGALPRRHGRAMRPNAGSSLECRLPKRIDGAEVRLAGPVGEVRRSVIDGSVTFTDLLPGGWRLELIVAGKVVERLDLRLESGRSHTIAVGPSASARNRSEGSGSAD